MSSCVNTMLIIITRQLPSWVKGLLYVDVLWGVNHLSMSRPLFSVLGSLHKWMFATVLCRNCSLAVNTLGDIAKNRLSLKQLKMYSWKLKRVYCKLRTIENELRSTGPNKVPLLFTRCLYWERGYIWKLKTVYCKLKMCTWKLKMIYLKLMTIEMSSGQLDPV